MGKAAFVRGSSEGSRLYLLKSKSVAGCSVKHCLSFDPSSFQSVEQTTDLIEWESAAATPGCRLQSI